MIDLKLVGRDGNWRMIKEPDIEKQKCSCGSLLTVSGFGYFEDKKRYRLDCANCGNFYGALQHDSKH